MKPLLSYKQSLGYFVTTFDPVSVFINNPLASPISFAEWHFIARLTRIMLANLLKNSRPMLSSYVR